MNIKKVYKHGDKFQGCDARQKNLTMREMSKRTAMCSDRIMQQAQNN